MKSLLRLQFLQRAFSTVKYKFRHGSAMIPHPDKVSKGGEDALYTHDNILAVADGVGGWAQHGIDPGLYSKKLCEIIKDLYLSTGQKDYIQQPQKLIADSVQKNREIGTTTICIMTLEQATGIIHSAYLGDSVYTIYRTSPPTMQYQKIYEAQQQQRQFNFPYQVGTQGDSPLLAVKHSMQLNIGDTIVMGSDGLWDNLHATELQSLVNSHSKEGQAKLAEEIAKTTYKRSLSTNYSSPFHEKAKKAKLYYPQQGKSDDITVITATVIKD